MTPRCGVRAALTEERSKAEIKSSALRRSDEKSPLTRTKKAGRQSPSFFLRGQSFAEDSHR
jgi:hypothetical protein